MHLHLVNGRKEQGWVRERGRKRKRGKGEREKGERGKGEREEEREAREKEKGERGPRLIRSTRVDSPMFTCRPKRRSDAVLTIRTIFGPRVHSPFLLSLNFVSFSLSSSLSSSLSLDSLFSFIPFSLSPSPPPKDNSIISHPPPIYSSLSHSNPPSTIH